MRIDVLSLFPNMFNGPMSESMLGKAIERKLIDFNITDFRDYTTNKHHNVDDYPFGGGAGMLLQPQPIFDALAHTQRQAAQHHHGKGRILLMDPAGKRFTQSEAETLSQEDHLTFICGHYEGYDERIKTLITDEYSLGDFVLTGGELPAMVMIDTISRLVPGVLGNSDSAPTDSFSSGLLEHPQYTRPADFRGMKVPEVLLSGNHQKIALWRQKKALKKTYLRRRDLINYDHLTDEQKQLLAEIKAEINPSPKYD